MRLIIPGKPQGWQRTGGQGDRRFTRPETRQAKRRIAQIAAWAVRGPLMDGPLSVSIVAVYPRPSRRPAAVSAEAWGTSERCWRPATPDADNLAKLVLDALNSIVWTDDAVVVDLRVFKVYAADGEQPCTEIEILPVEERACTATTLDDSPDPLPVER